MKGTLTRLPSVRLALLVIAICTPGCASRNAAIPIGGNVPARSVANDAGVEQTISVVHAFSGAVLTSCSATAATLDGAYPTSTLRTDGSGDVFGTTETGGPCGAGTIFKLSLNATGKWAYHQIYAFTGGSDGGGSASGLIFDSDGNGFGTAASGGEHGLGVVYELSPPSVSKPQWTERVLYSFKGLPDGAGPIADLVMRDGRLFGTTTRGGHSHIGCLQGCGTIFELAKTARGGWRENVLHEFLDALGEGANPYAGLSAGNNGSFFGTTYYGGNDLVCGGLGCGTVFELKQRKGQWKLRTLRAFKPQDGAFPDGPVLLDGNRLYGTTGQGGTYNYGTLFRFVRNGDRWLPEGRFNFNNADGNEPTGALTLSGSTLYGTTVAGGANLWGTIYTAQANAKNWQELPIYSFTGGSDGATPLGTNVLLLGDGSFLSTAEQGGALSACSGNGCGTIIAGSTGSRTP